jgi:putative phosphoribosyl transferase
VAHALKGAGFATLQPELLDRRQALERHNAFDADLQCLRLLQVLRWLDRVEWARALPLGCYATGIGASVALLAAAKRPERIAAIACRSARPDKAQFWLSLVKAPTLFIVEQPDWCNDGACGRLPAEHELVIVPSRSHRFHEPAARGAVVQHVRRWFLRYLSESAPTYPGEGSSRY